MRPHFCLHHDGHACWQSEEGAGELDVEHLPPDASSSSGDRARDRRRADTRHCSPARRGGPSSLTVVSTRRFAVAAWLTSPVKVRARRPAARICAAVLSTSSSPPSSRHRDRIDGIATRPRHHHVRPQPGERHRGGPPDPAQPARARHHRHLAVQHAHERFLSGERPRQIRAASSTAGTRGSAEPSTPQSGAGRKRRDPAVEADPPGTAWSRSDRRRRSPRVAVGSRGIGVGEHRVIEPDPRKVRDEQLRRSPGLELGHDLGGHARLLHAGVGIQEAPVREAHDAPEPAGQPCLHRRLLRARQIVQAGEAGDDDARVRRQRRAPRGPRGDAANQRGVFARGRDAARRGRSARTAETAPPRAPSRSTSWRRDRACPDGGCGCRCERRRCRRRSGARGREPRGAAAPRAAAPGSRTWPRARWRAGTRTGKSQGEEQPGRAHDRGFYRIPPQRGHREFLTFRGGGANVGSLSSPRRPPGRPRRACPHSS